jgi:hypothetical protein
MARRIRRGRDPFAFTWADRARVARSWFAGPSRVSRWFLLVLVALAVLVGATAMTVVRLRPPSPIYVLPYVGDPTTAPPVSGNRADCPAPGSVFLCDHPTPRGEIPAGTAIISPSRPPTWRFPAGPSSASVPDGGAR